MTTVLAYTKSATEDIQVEQQFLPQARFGLIIPMWLTVTPASGGGVTLSCYTSVLVGTRLKLALS